MPYKRKWLAEETFESVREKTNILGFDLVVLEKKIFFYVFHIVSLCELMTHGVGADESLGSIFSESSILSKCKFFHVFLL